MEKLSGLIRGGLSKDGFSRGPSFLQCPGCLQWRQTFQDTVFLNGGPLGAGVECARRGSLGPWSSCDCTAINSQVFWIFSCYQDVSKFSARAVNSARRQLPTPACISLLRYLVWANESGSQGIFYACVNKGQNVSQKGFPVLSYSLRLIQPFFSFVRLNVDQPVFWRNTYQYFQVCLGLFF